MKPLFIAHRGDTVNFPENTIEAFQSAFEKGADGIELDLQFHAGNLIVVHDYLFDRTKSYPLLENVLKQFSDQGRIEIEVKSMDLDFIPTLQKLLNQYANADIELTTSVFPLAHHLREAFLDFPLGIIFLEKEFEEWMPEEFTTTKVLKLMQLMQGNVAHVVWSKVNHQMVQNCHKNNVKFHSHILKQDINKQLTTYKEMEKLGIDQCTFDDISLLTILTK